MAASVLVYKEICVWWVSVFVRAYVCVCVYIYVVCVPVYMYDLYMDVQMGDMCICVYLCMHQCMYECVLGCSKT